MNVPENIKSKLRVESGFASIRVLDALADTNVSEGARPLALAMAIHSVLAQRGLRMTQVVNALIALGDWTAAESAEVNRRLGQSAAAIPDEDTAAWATGEAMAFMSAYEPTPTPEDLLIQKDA